jgi:hypothetical protein
MLFRIQIMNRSTPQEPHCILNLFFQDGKHLANSRFATSTKTVNIRSSNEYGIPRTQPLAARATTERRRQRVREIRPWEQAPTYRKGQARHGTASPEPAAETLPQETEEPRTAASAQLKRQRKTTPKKTMRKQHTRR